MLIHSYLPTKLKKRILLLFFCFTLLFSVLLSAVFLTLLKSTEKKLQIIDMGLAVERIRKQYLQGENIGRVNRFFHGKKNSTDFPDWLQNLPVGFHKIQRDHLIWHIMIVDYPDQRYILLRDYTVFEATRLHPLLLSLLVLLSSLLLSLILVWITLYFVINPIEKLEHSVRMELSNKSQKPFAQGYDQNEIGQLAKAFDEVYNQFRQALQREKLFTADVSHELRTPLMVILSSVELLLTHPELSDKAQQRLVKIEHAVAQILQRLEVYLALARQTSSSITQFKQQSIIEIAETVINENLTFSLKYNVKLLLQTNHIDQLYPADFSYTILSNLVKNAIEYAGEQSTISINLYEYGFSVSDDGIGISSEFQPRMFTAFSESNSNTSHHLGLGLSLIQRICEYLNWNIEFLSKQGKGTCFTIYTHPNDEK